MAPLPSLEWPFPSQSGQYELLIQQQPRSHHRAHYETEGSRGAVKTSNGGHPEVQVLFSVFGGCGVCKEGKESMKERSLSLHICAATSFVKEKLSGRRGCKYRMVFPGLCCVYVKLTAMQMNERRHYSHKDKLLGHAEFKSGTKYNNSYKSCILACHTSVVTWVWFICCSGELINKPLLSVFLALLHKLTMQSSVLAMPVR